MQPELLQGNHSAKVTDGIEMGLQHREAKAPGWQRGGCRRGPGRYQFAVLWYSLRKVRLRGSFLGERKRSIVGGGGSDWSGPLDSSKLTLCRDGVAMGSRDGTNVPHIPKGWRGAHQ